MEPSQKAYRRRIWKQDHSLVISIPIHIVRSLNLEAGQELLMGESDGLIISKPTESKLSKKDLKADFTPETQQEKGKTPEGKTPADKTPEKKPKYDDPFDDPDFDPLAKLRIK